MNPGFLRTASILVAFLVGACLPQAHTLSWLIRWLIMAMLFVVFLQTRLSREALHRSHAVLLAVNLLMGFVGWGLGWLAGGSDVALAGFFCGITPTATAAPVIVSFLRGKVDYVVAAFLLTNLTIAALLPVLMPLVLGRHAPTAFADVLGSVALVVFAPMLAAALVRKLHPAATAWPGRLRNFSFAAWVVVLFLITARVAAFLHANAGIPRIRLLQIAALAALLCAANFALGRLIGGRAHAREASQSLGQKNTTFTIYLALAYATPLVALGPTCYVLWHNLWNSWQLHRHARAETAPARRGPPAPARS